jgi:hypothetical protein
MTQDNYVRDFVAFLTLVVIVVYGEIKKYNGVWTFFTIITMVIMRGTARNFGTHAKFKDLSGPPTPPPTPKSRFLISVKNQRKICHTNLYGNFTLPIK